MKTRNFCLTEFGGWSGGNNRASSMISGGSALFNSGMSLLWIVNTGWLYFSAAILLTGSIHGARAGSPANSDFKVNGRNEAVWMVNHSR
jgi:hypothetical protein